jgi:hypothetical protein
VYRLTLHLDVISFRRFVEKSCEKIQI